MKIYVEPQITEDISQYSDEELKECGTYEREYSTKPIVLSSVSLKKNSKGQYVFSFATKNHKYLNIEYSISSSRRESDDGKKYWSRCFRISTCQQYPFKDEKTNKKLFESSISTLRVWLEPDNDEENELINGKIAVFPTKWQYHVVIIPFEDMKILAENNIKTLEEEVIYDI